MVKDLATALELGATRYPPRRPVMSRQRPVRRLEQVLITPRSRWLEQASNTR
jgi:hypothetical protein